MHAAVKLDIFTLLDGASLSAKDVAGKINGSERGVTVLLNALVAMELLARESNGKFANTPSSKKFLSLKSDNYIGYMVMHHHHLVDGWAQLDKAVLSGEPIQKRSHGDEVERESFLMGMSNMAMAIAPKLTEQVDLFGRKHLLDLGGGPGTHAVHFCLANPDLKATVYDLPTTKAFAKKTAEKYGVGDRVDFISGDFLTDPISGEYDAAWLSQILHSHGPDACQNVIDKTVRCLTKGGIVMIHEFFLNETLDGPLFPAVFSLNMLINNEKGRSYSEKEVSKMLKKSGVREIHKLPFLGPNESYVLCGTV